MTMVLSRTGVSSRRMQQAARELLTEASAFDGMPASAVGELNLDRDQVTHALRRILETRQEVSICSLDFQRSLRTRLTGVDDRDGDLRLTLARHEPALFANGNRAIMTSRFLKRPAVFALEPTSGDDATLRIAMPAWMLLAEQRTALRVNPAGYRISLPGFGSVPLADLSDDGMSFDLPAASPLPFRTDGWPAFVQLLGGDEPLYPMAVQPARSQTLATGRLRVGVRLHAMGDHTRQRLRRLIGRHIDSKEITGLTL